ncbi:MAG: response regulator, partial [Deltaproteobacteria bacterium]|nr:response regulator [Deltaproteobacteria bacterium]
MPKILAIDDKKDNLITLSALLKALLPDCEVITALSGPEGVEKAKAELPDTILLDIKMPGMDGYEVCNRLKEDEQTKHIPVIMISAIKTESEDLVKGLESGADAYLAKPIDEYVLTAQVKTALRVKRAEDMLRDQKDLLEEMVRERTRALRESEERMKAILRASPVGIGLFMNRELQWGNETLHRMLGYEDGSLSGQNARIFYADDEEFDRVGQEHIPVVEKNGIGEIETRWMRKDGTTFDCRIRSCSFHPRGPIKGYIVTVGDISESKRLEAQLQQAQKMEAIGTLAGGIAHDFNNILGAIIGYAELAKMKAPPESDVVADLNQVIKSGNRAADLVHQILTVSRRHKKKRQPMQLKYIVKEALKMLKATLPSTIEIREDSWKDAGAINADPAQMHQVIMNLCTNAGQAMQQNGGVLEVRIGNMEVGAEDPGSRYLDLPPGSYLRLTVKDTGYGIPRHIMDKIFDPYFTTKDVGEGTGLGLSVAQGIVKAHGGTITAYSEPGQGTTFNVYLPIMDEAEKAEKEESKEPLPTGSERILFIDDEQALVEIGSQMLERLGYEVVSKKSSVQALELFRAEPDKFDLVITDMTMPHMTGDKLAQELMKIRPDIPIILCTGHSRLVSEKKAKEMGIRELVFKPLVMRNLAE